MKSADTLYFVPRRVRQYIANNCSAKANWQRYIDKRDIVERTPKGWRYVISNRNGRLATSVILEDDYYCFDTLEAALAHLKCECSKARDDVNDKVACIDFLYANIYDEWDNANVNN